MKVGPRDDFEIPEDKPQPKTDSKKPLPKPTFPEHVERVLGFAVTQTQLPENLEKTDIGKLFIKSEAFQDFAKNKVGHYKIQVFENEVDAQVWLKEPVDNKLVPVAFWSNPQNGHVLFLFKDQKGEPYQFVPPPKGKDPIEKRFNFAANHEKLASGESEPTKEKPKEHHKKETTSFQ